MRKEEGLNATTVDGHMPVNGIETETVLVDTNIGQIPYIDYLDIVAIQYGFDDYKDMTKNGFYVDM